MPRLHTGELLQPPRVFPENKNKLRRQIDYIFIISGNTESKIDGKDVDVDKAIKKYYEPVFISPDHKIGLYKIKHEP